MSSCTVSFSFPGPAHLSLLDSTTSVSTGFSVEAQGTGSFAGLSYTIPAHTKGRLKAKIQVMAITSADVEQLNSLVMSMLSASKKDEVKTHEETHASANISIWSLFGGGASASYE